MTGDTALRLAAAFGTTPEFWMNLQKNWELETARDTARGVDFAAMALAELDVALRSLQTRLVGNNMRYSTKIITASAMPIDRIGLLSTGRI